MAFFNNKHGTNTNEERNSDADDEEFHSIFEIEELKSLNLDEEEDFFLDKSDKDTKIIESSGQNSDIITDTEVMNSKRMLSDEFSEGNRTFDVNDQRLKGGFKVAIMWNNKGVVLSRLGKYTEAVEAYEQALKIDPDYSSAWKNKGVTLSRMGKYTEAIEAYDRGLMIDLNYSALYENHVILKPGISTLV